jgi:hypothetical protein
VHLLQNSRDTKALHPVFCGLAQRRADVSSVFSRWRRTFSADLRNFLTGLELDGLNPAFPSAITVSFGEVAIAKRLSLCSCERILGDEKKGTRT